MQDVFDDAPASDGPGAPSPSRVDASSFKPPAWRRAVAFVLGVLPVGIILLFCVGIVGWSQNWGRAMFWLGVTIVAVVSVLFSAWLSFWHNNVAIRVTDAAVSTSRLGVRQRTFSREACTFALNTSIVRANGVTASVIRTLFVAERTGRRRGIPLRLAPRDIERLRERLQL